MSSAGSAGHDPEVPALLLGRLLSRTLGERKSVGSLSEVEFRVFSQFGDDGIIQWLVRRLPFPHRTFVEFGVGDYVESNTRFLLLNDNWSGLVLDSSERNIRKIRGARFFWRHQLLAEAAFVTRENIASLLRERGFGGNVGILHIDVDGNDYWMWEALGEVAPVLAIIEYNSVFGAERAISIPYRADFDRTAGHASNLYFGASLAALDFLARRMGYTLVGSNSAGNNAYFVRSESLREGVPTPTVAEAYVESRFRESRGRDGKLTLLSGAARLEALRGMPVQNVVTGQMETL